MIVLLEYINPFMSFDKPELVVFIMLALCTMLSGTYSKHIAIIEYLFYLCLFYDSTPHYQELLSANF